MPATDAAHSDQASRAAVRALTRPLGGRGQPPNTPRSLIAQAGPSDGALSYPAVVVRLGLLDVLLTGDRPGIVTDFVPDTCLPGLATASRVSSQLSDGPLEPVTRRKASMGLTSPGVRG
jgi:hypothetical protein